MMLRDPLFVVALLGAVVPVVRLSSVPAEQHLRRRAAAMERLEGRILIVPSQGAFKSDDQAGFQQTSDFQYLTGLGDLLGAVLLLDGGAKRATLFVPGPNPAISRPRPQPGAESAAALGLDAVLPIDSLTPWLTRRLGSASGVLVARPGNPNLRRIARNRSGQFDRIISPC